MRRSKYFDLYFAYLVTLGYVLTSDNTEIVVLSMSGRRSGGSDSIVVDQFSCPLCPGSILPCGISRVRINSPIQSEVKEADCMIGRRLNVPIYQLLGGKVRNKVQVYAWIGGDRPKDVEEAA